MSEAAKLLLAAVRQLPPEEQEEFAEALHESLLTDEDPALLAELERRRLEHESGRAPGIDGEEFFRRLREQRS